MIPLAECLPQRLQVDNPDRWRRALQHPEIRRYIDEKKRIKICHATRRGFKTEIAKRKLIEAVMTTEGCNYFAAAPTKQHAQEIFWEDLIAFSPPNSLVHTNAMGLWLTYVTGCRIKVIGLAVPTRLNGIGPWHGGVVDEAGSLKPDTINRHILKAVADTNGWLILLGVPRDEYCIEYRELVTRIKNNPTKFPDFGVYTWPGKDILPPEEIELSRELDDPDVHLVEYGGEFSTRRSPMAYSNFDKDAHVKARPIDPNIPLAVFCDFNIDPCCWAIGQIDERHQHVIREVVLRKTTLWQMCTETKRVLIELCSGSEEEARRRFVEFYGDYSGSKRRDVTAVRSSWQIIEGQFRDAGWNIEVKKRPNPVVQDRVNALQGRLLNDFGDSRFSCDPSCQFLVKDFTSVTHEMLHKTTDVGDRTHMSDAVGYAAFWYRRAVIAQ